VPPGLLILAALDLESRALAAALGLSRVSKTSFASPNGSANSSSAGSGPFIELHTIGIRATSMPGTLSSTAPILLAGLAGGLDPTLRTGDLIVEGCTPDLAAKISAKCGRIHTANRIIGAPHEKTDLFRQTGACAVDMESAIVRAAAASLNRPLYTIRAICDPADMSLGQALTDCVDEFGHPRAVPLAKNLLRHPSLIPTLLRLHTASQAALKSLASGVSRFVAEFEQSQS
jgi:adenosylhomocysteine nucleosidase